MPHMDLSLARQVTMFTHVRRLIAKEYSSANALALTAGIHQHDRWSTFDRYRRSAEYCGTRMREYALEEIEQWQSRPTGQAASATG